MVTHYDAVARHQVLPEPSPPVDEVQVHWGRDVLVIRDTTWCEKIAEEALLPRAELDYSAGVRHSRRETQLRMDMAAAGFGSFEDRPTLPKGIRPAVQRPVAAQCLKELLGLGLPAALTLRHIFGQSERLIALCAELEVYQSHRARLAVNIVVEGLQLYASGHIGRQARPSRMTDMTVQRRALDNTWCDISFDGEKSQAAPVSRWALHPRRTFYLSDNEIVDESGARLRSIST